MKCHERQDLLLLYASGQLDQAERDEVRAHLATGCPTCTAQLAEAQAIIEQIGLVVDPVTPPDQLREELLARAAQHTGSKGTVRHPGRSGGVAPPDRTGPRRFRANRAAVWTVALGGAVTAVALAYGLASRQYFSELEDARQTAQSLEERASEAETKIERSDSFIERVHGIMASAALEVIAFEGGDDFPDGTGRLLWDRDSNTCYITVKSLADRLEENLKFALWFLTDDNDAVLGAKFEIDQSGHATFEIKLPDEVPDFTRATITRHSEESEQHPDSNLLFGRLGE